MHRPRLNGLREIFAGRSRAGGQDSSRALIAAETSFGTAEAVPSHLTVLHDLQTMCSLDDILPVDCGRK